MAKKARPTRRCTRTAIPLRSIAAGELGRFADASRPRNGAADCNPLVAWRYAPHNHADQADIGRQSLRLFRPRGLSAAPLGFFENHMYCPAHFQENRLPELISLIEQFPLATIVCNGPSGLVADHIPLMYEGELGAVAKLVGHVAKNNPLWQVPVDQELLVVFQGPSTYISPNWYASKRDAGKVVPTWNYAVVHATCTLEAIHDPEQVLEIITRLTDQHEASQTHPWRVTDAPIEFTDRLVGNIVGIKLKINRIDGKWKVSQNQPTSNQQSVVQGLLAEGTDAQTQMALLVGANESKL